MTSSKVISAGWPAARLGEVGDVVDDGQRAEQLGLVDEVAHPGAAVLVVALEVVAVEERERLAVGVEDLEDADVGVVDGEVVALFEGDAVELVGGVEDAVLQDVVELEVGLDLDFVEVVLGLADLLGVEVPVPGLELESRRSGASMTSLDVFGFAVGLGGRGGDERVHELEGGFRGLGHLVFELPGGVGRESRAAWPLRRGAGRGGRWCRGCRWRRRARRGSRSSRRGSGGWRGY